MGKALADFGLQLGQSAIGTGMGMLLGKWNDKRQLEMQRKLNAMQLQDSKAMTDYTFQKQLQMWKDTNFSAQKDQMKQAGLNPGLLYGMSGGGGTTTGGGASMVGSGHAPTGGGEAVALGMHAAQLGLLNAQRENIEADTKNKESENPNIPLKGEETKARTLDLLQGVENKKAQKRLTDLQADIEELNKQIKSATKKDTIELVGYELERAVNEVERLFRQNVINKATQDDIIKKVSEETIGAGLDNLLRHENIQLTKTQTDALTQKVAQEWERISIEWERTGISDFEAQTNRLQYELNNWLHDVTEGQKTGISSASNLVSGIIQMIFFRKLLKGGGKPIRGFHTR